MTKVICELGINHNGSIDTCKKLIKQAHQSGSWGIKFQYRNLQNYFSSDNKETELGKEIIDKEINKNYLSPSKIKILSQFAKKLNLQTGISFFSSKDIKDFKNYKFDFYKIPSAASDNIFLLKNILSLNKLTLISLGGRTLPEIKKITKNISKKNSNRVVLLHCVSNYPVNIINSNLGFIDVLKQKFKGFMIGYSSHESDIYNCIYALSKKINFIERHITLDANSQGLDHSSSSEYKDFKILNFYSKNLEIIDNKNAVKNINQGEIINLQNLGSSYIFNKNVKKGAVLKKKLLKLSQPKIGIDDLTLPRYLGKKLNNDIKINTPLTSDLFYKVNLSKKHNLFVNSKKISIPIRPHDYLKLNNEIKGKFYELHLSFKDVELFNKNSIVRNFLETKSFSVHAPDYVDENNIVDLFAKNKELRKKSLKLLTKCLKLCKYLTSISKKQTNLIISISKHDNMYSRKTFYLKVLNFIKKIKKIYNVNIIPQWLPVYAWYFGGSEKINIFSNPDDLKFLNKIGLKICLDTSHFLLSCNYYKKIQI